MRRRLVTGTLGAVTGAPPTSHLGADAWAAAVEAAEPGGLAVREVSAPSELREIERLLNRVWENGQQPPPVSGDIMRMLSYTGAYVAGAYTSSGLVGAAVGFLSDTLGEVDGAHLHSHITGVAPEHRGRQVGFALKLHQRAWALERGFDRITWTFDPLVRRNAYFNLAKLGAGAIHYLVDFYGEMRDGLNAGQGSDRLLVEWRLTEPQVVAAARGRTVAPAAGIARAARVVLRCGPGHVPEPVDEPDPGPVICELPPDIEAVRRTDPALARAWRYAIRSVLHTALSRGGRVAGFHQRLGYLLDDLHGGSR